jgi:signal transduction histidine kinase/ActR/RegA family two-component response regulator
VLRRRASCVAPDIPAVDMPETMAFGAGITGAAAAERRTVYVPDATRDRRVANQVWTRSGLTSMLAVPLIAGDALLGVLAVRARHSALAHDEDQALVASLAARAAVALQNASTYAHAVHRAARLRELAAVSQSIAGSLDLREVMQRIVRAAASLHEGALAVVHTYDAEHGTMRFAGYSDDALLGLPDERDAGAGLPGLVLQRRAAALVENPVEHTRTMAREWWRQRPRATYYGMPIMVGDALVGVLDFIRPDGAPDAEEQEALSVLAAHAGLAIRNASVYEAERTHAERAAALARAGRELTATLDADRVAPLIARRMCDLVPSRACTVFRLEEDGSLAVIAADGEDADAFRGLTLRSGEGIVGRVVNERTAVATADLLHDPAITLSIETCDRLSRARHRAAVAVPLMAGDRVIGALCAVGEAGRVFTADERQMLQAIADQAALALENARLYASARESLDRLRETQAQLVTAGKMTALGQLVSGVAHELNNPLSVIIGYGQLLLHRQIPEPFRRPVELMVAQGDRMAKIVRNLLFFARQRPPERTAVDLNQVIEQTLALRLHQLTLAGIAVERDFGELPTVTGDGQQLQQVFLNLILNAEQAITAAKQGSRIAFRTRTAPDGRRVRAEVVDDGPGIPPNVIAHVFEPFFTTKEVGTGTGLGLSVSYGIIEEHEGTLTVTSRPGRTVFTVELPVGVPAVVTGVPSPVVLSSMSSAIRRALVVEDEPEVADLVQTLLTEVGWRVDLAGGGRAALDHVRQIAYDLIVSDLRMADGSGEDFYRAAVQENPALRQRFVFMTGDLANADSCSFLESANIPVIEKPFAPDQFLDAVRRVARPTAARAEA